MAFALNAWHRRTNSVATSSSTSFSSTSASQPSSSTSKPISSALTISSATGATKFITLSPNRSNNELASTNSSRAHVLTLSAPEDVIDNAAFNRASNRAKIAMCARASKDTLVPSALDHARKVSNKFAVKSSSTPKAARSPEARAASSSALDAIVVARSASTAACPAILARASRISSAASHALPSAKLRTSSPALGSALNADAVEYARVQSFASYTTSCASRKNSTTFS
mmetsp:Transcript_1384/g.5012  ORF Transcript_1384/g.5012 Transcript_1384/m.5012 type:complete len:229 (-) Transcript_1384:601-1287(-)